VRPQLAWVSSCALQCGVSSDQISASHSIIVHAYLLCPACLYFLYDM